MISCLNAEVRRCRPLLGTFVEVVARGPHPELVQRAVEAAFSEMERVAASMSVHDPESELSRVNASALLRPVAVGNETFHVLTLSLGLARESNGAFDPSVAPILARWGLLPSYLGRRQAGSWSDVRLLPGCRVRFHRPLSLDLGGIAKGYAVDCAVNALRANGACSGLVNAGGDLRAFGNEGEAVHVRNPMSPGSLPFMTTLREAALATSSPCFTQRTYDRGDVSHLVDPRNGQAITRAISVTVQASECWLADALTKVVLNDPACAETLLERYGAEALVLSE